MACVCRKVPPALGEPVFDRLEAKLAHAMLSLPATKVAPPLTPPLTLTRYPLATQGLPLEFQQNKAPKVTADGFAPATWAANPACEWCPPGHGDLYPAMVGSGSF